MSQKQQIFSFLKSQRYTVVSSITSDGQPHSALVAFSQTENDEIIFGSDKNTRKVKNITAGSRLSLVIGLSYPISVQLEGKAELVDDSQREKLINLHIEKHPTSEKYARLPNQAYIRFTPEWARYTDLGKSPAEIFEVSFDS